MSDTHDTIVAIASPAAPAPRGIVRLSGEDLLQILAALEIDTGTTTQAHQRLGKIQLGSSLGGVEARWLVWPTSRSYTGQPSAEVHLPGSLPILQAMVDRAVSVGARTARPGEFTMRAFLAGRLDLTQAEAVLGVIEAEQRGSLDHALQQLAGNLARPLEKTRSALLDLIADVEAGLDFVDEDIEFITDEALAGRLDGIARVLRRTREQLQTREASSGRVTIALLGEPNAGKSQLLNRLAEGNASIVSERAGTTRDNVIAEGLLQGQPVRWIDTAGIEPSGDEISRRAQEQSQRAAVAADVRLWCIDLSSNLLEDAVSQARAFACQRRTSQSDLWVGTKADATERRLPVPWLNTSGVTGAGVDSLAQAITECIGGRDWQETGSITGTAIRCRESLRNAVEAVEAAHALNAGGEGHELIAAELRTAATSVGEVTGSVYTDDILDRVFGRFCIGK